MVAQNRLVSGFLVLATLAAAPCVGCKRKAAETVKSSPDNTRPPIGNILPSVGRLAVEKDLREFAGYYLAAASTDKPPRSLSEMPPEFRRDMPKTYKAFEDGNYVVFWGADPKRSLSGWSKTLLAYEKATPEKGGLVVFLDHHVENVSAQEFPTFAKPSVK
jgi:hypothetical protein